MARNLKSVSHEHLLLNVAAEYIRCRWRARTRARRASRRQRRVPDALPTLLPHDRAHATAHGGFATKARSRTRRCTSRWEFGADGRKEVPGLWIEQTEGAKF